MHVSLPSSASLFIALLPFSILANPLGDLASQNSPLDSPSSNALLKRNYKVSGHHRHKNAVVRDAFLGAITLANIASDHPAVSESLRRRIALNYFRPEEYETAKRAFRNIVADRPREGDPRLSAVEVLMDDLTVALCRTKSQRGDGSDIHAAILNRKDGKGGMEEAIVICAGFWRDIGREVVPTCENVGTVVSHQMRNPAGTILHEFMHLDWVKPSRIRGDIQDHEVQDTTTDTVPYLTAPATAYAIRDYGPPGAALTSAVNYEMFALELFWTFHCRRTFTKPINEFEGKTGNKYRKDDKDLLKRRSVLSYAERF